MPPIMPRMASYRVKKGDTLWNIAKQVYGDPSLWQEISKANQLSDPRRLLAGLTLKFPTIQPAVAGRPGTSAPGLRTPLHPSVPVPNAANHAAKCVLPPTFKITPTDLLKNLEVGAPGSNCKMNLTFELYVSCKGALEVLEVSRDGLDITIFKNEAKRKFSKLLTESKLKFDPSRKAYELTLGSGAAITDAKGNVLLATGVGFTPDGRAKYYCKQSEVKIPLGNYEFKGQFGFEVECRTDDESRRQRSSVPAVVPGTNWSGPLIVAGEVVLAGSIVVLIAVTLPVDAVVAAGAITFSEAATLLGGLAPALP